MAVIMRCEVGQYEMSEEGPVDLLLRQAETRFPSSDGDVEAPIRRSRRGDGAKP